MTIEAAQKVVHEWICGIGKGYFSELTNMAVLTEEVGELARVMARVYGDQVPKLADLPEDVRHQLDGAPVSELKAAMKPRLAEEMADVLWVLICLANQTGINLTDALAASLAKKTARDATRFEHKD